MSLIKDFGPQPSETAWLAAQAALARSERAMIGHLDTGLTPHPALGFRGDDAPANIRLDLGRNLFDPDRLGPRPMSDGVIGDRLADKILDWPDHGSKTLSMVLSDQAELRGAAPGAPIAPFRISDGPVFETRAASACLAEGIEACLALSPAPAVINVSMGTPGGLGVFEWVRTLLTGGAPGVAQAVGRAVDAAYEAGVILVCAGGQVTNTVVFPGRFRRTIAVGGCSPSDAHYPFSGYDRPNLIDVWALATDLNRAASPIVDGRMIHIFAEDPRDPGGDPSGTSYATPLVAAAAAMWVETHHDALSQLAHRGRWRIVEAFRAALRASARACRLTRPTLPAVSARKLDTEALLRTPPRDPDASAEQPPAAGELSWF